MKPNQKASQQHQAESHQEQHLTAQGAHEFPDTDELLRFDASTTKVPPNVARRIQRSLGSAPASSWWKRLFGW